jgi:hypothetical protein
MTTLSGTSPLTRRGEVVTVYTTLTDNGELFYLATVSPQQDAYRNDAAFRNMVRSVRFSY